MTQNVPEDPRTLKGLPPLGTLETVTRISDELVRVIAPNPSPNTLDGTNTYVILDRVGGAALIVDPGPVSESHYANVKRVLDEAQVEAIGIFLTHHHLDHSETARLWSQDLGVGVSAFLARLVFGVGRVLGDDDVFELGNRKIKVVETPGHVHDHLAFQTDDGHLLAGDHILGRSTSVIAYPDGDLEKYLSSLTKVKNLGSQIILPGHGPEISEELSADVIDYYITHRHYRLAQIVSILDQDISLHVDDLTGKIYGPELPESLFLPAKQSTRASLTYLVQRDVIEVDEEERYSLI
ncbi:MAG: MBL fold metallo-hydrolase [Actinomycetota bacterium]|nr:MBL fold metallo-hydrolase [Actinomycetota bacterium]